MAERQTTKTRAKSNGFTAEERAAMRERTRELKAAARGKASRAEGEADVKAKIGEMTGSDRTMAKRIHELVSAAAPELVPRTWYGMPAYAKDGKVVCFFKPSEKFKMRYATFEFNDAAALDDGAMWPIGYALKELTSREEKRISALVKQAAG